MPSKFLHIRYWPHDKERWLRRAEERGMSLSEWFRWLADKDIDGCVLERKRELRMPVQESG